MLINQIDTKSIGALSFYHNLELSEVSEVQKIAKYI